MAGEGQGYQGVVLPSLFGDPGSALKSGIALKERQAERNDALAQRQSEIDYRRQKDLQAQADKDEMDQYRKVQLLKDYLDVNKHQTGEAVVDALANQKSNELLKKWTTALQQNPKLSYADLLNGTSTDMGKLIPSLDSARDELKQSDAAVQMIKQKFPEADTQKILQDLRTDILHRRVDNNGNFVNPTLVPPSEFANQLANPIFLSKYITGTKDLAQSFLKPQTTDVGVYVGNPNDAHTRMEAKLPDFMKLNYNPETDTQPNTGGAFLKRGITPQLQLRASTLPSESIGEVNGKPFQVIDKDVFNSRMQNPNIAVQTYAQTRKMYPNFDNMNPTEQELAARNAMFQVANSAQGQHGFHATVTANSPRTTINVNGNKANSDIKDAYSEILNKLPEEGKALSFNKLTPTTQNAVLSLAQTNYGKVKYQESTPTKNDPNHITIKERPLNQSDIAIYKNPETNEVGIYTVGQDKNGVTRIDKLIAPLSQFDVNSKVNTGIKARQEVLRKDSTPYNSYSINGKDYSHDELLKMGYKDDQIQQALQLGTIKHKNK